MLYVGMYRYHKAARVMILDMGYRPCIYLGCGYDYELRRAQSCYRLLLYSTGGGLHWVRDVRYEDQGAMQAEGQARLEPPRNPSYVSTGFCMSQLAVDYMGSGMVDVSTVADVGIPRRANSCFAACVLLCKLVFALYP